MWHFALIVLILNIAQQGQVQSVVIIVCLTHALLQVPLEFDFTRELHMGTSIRESLQEHAAELPLLQMVRGRQTGHPGLQGDNFMGNQWVLQEK